MAILLSLAVMSLCSLLKGTGIQQKLKRFVLLTSVAFAWFIDVGKSIVHYNTAL